MSAAAVASSRSRPIAAWTLQILLAAVFTAAALAKFAGVPMLVAEFEQIGLGQWFRILTGLVEIAGAIMLLVPGFAVAGAAWLGFTMVCATVTHLTVLHSNPAPAIVLVVLAAVVVWLRQDQIAGLRARFL